MTGVAEMRVKSSRRTYYFFYRREAAMMISQFSPFKIAVLIRFTAERKETHSLVRGHYSCEDKDYDSHLPAEGARSFKKLTTKTTLFHMQTISSFHSPNNDLKVLEKGKKKAFRENVFFS